MAGVFVVAGMGAMSIRVGVRGMLFMSMVGVVMMSVVVHDELMILYARK
jgi:hypothetical protein